MASCRQFRDGYPTTISRRIMIRARRFFFSVRTPVMPIKIATLPVTQRNDHRSPTVFFFLFFFGNAAEYRKKGSRRTNHCNQCRTRSSDHIRFFFIITRDRFRLLRILFSQAFTHTYIRYSNSSRKVRPRTTASSSNDTASVGSRLSVTPSLPHPDFGIGSDEEHIRRRFRGGNKLR